MSQRASPPAQIVAARIVRTVELGVRIVDAALAGETTVLPCELLVDGPGRCPGRGIAGSYRDTIERRVSDVRWSGIRSSFACGCRATAVSTTAAKVRGSFTTPADPPRVARRPPASAAFILRRLMLDEATVAAVAREFGRGWDTVIDIAVEATTHAAALRRLGPPRWVEVIGVDEHDRAHVHGRGSGFRHRDHRPDRRRTRSRLHSAARHGPGRSAAAMTS